MIRTIKMRATIIGRNGNRKSITRRIGIWTMIITTFTGIVRRRRRRDPGIGIRARGRVRTI
jgi:hypothetical protein